MKFQLISIDEIFCVLPDMENGVKRGRFVDIPCNFK